MTDAYIKLAEKGKTTWNRWVRSILTDDTIDNFIEKMRKLEFKNQSIDELSKLKKLKPFSDEEKRNLKRELSIDIFELRRMMIFEGSIEYSHFEGFIFPMETIFKNCEFKVAASYSNCIFLNMVLFENTNFNDNFFFNDTAFISPINIKNTNFKKKSSFVGMKTNISICFDNTTFDGKAIFNNAVFVEFKFYKVIFNCDVDFYNATFLSSSLFIGSEFNQSVSFKLATFNGKTEFNGAGFGESCFDVATFNDEVIFDCSCFFKPSSFMKSKFKKNASFKLVYFIKDAVFSDAEFSYTTNFNDSTFKRPPKFHNVKFHQDTSFHKTKYISKSGDEGDVRAWRTLKLAMNNLHDRDLELLYYSYEMDAKIPILWEEGKYFKSALILVYKITSKYGQSLLLPVIWFLIILVLFSGLYNLVSFSGLYNQNSWLDIFQGPYDCIRMSISNSLPFVPMNKSVLNNILNDNEVSLCFQSLAVVQSVLSMGTIFLFGLGLKNIFSIK